MTPFSFERAPDLTSAVKSGGRFLAGGTNLVDLMKENVERPAHVTDINSLPLRDITELPKGRLRLGALATNADTADHPVVQARYPLLASAILAGASPQLRNAATNGGNLLQRTRCFYFYDTATACNKRTPGAGCAAIGGLTRMHAILGSSDKCIATHPSDMCVALRALDAQVNVVGVDGERSIAFKDFHRLPGASPEKDSNLQPGELITGIDLPAKAFDRHYTYLKLRDRLSYAFALVSVAVALEINDGIIAEARVALGGVAHKPWRNEEAEQMLVGHAPDPELFARFADDVLREARGQGDNDFKIELARRAIKRALEQAAARRPQSQTYKRIA